MQIATRSATDMARATEKADAAVRRLVQSYGQVGVESKIISSAAAGASDSALKLFAGIDAGVAAFARVGSQGSAAFKAIGASSESALQSAQARILQLADKVRQVKDQAATLTKTAVSQRESGGLDDDGLKKRLADIRAVQAAELERISATFRADSDARRAAQAERASSSTGAISAIGGASTAQASAQAQVYAAFLNVQAVAAQNAAQAQARLNEVTAAVSAASDRARASQQAAYETKIAYIASVNEEAAALFRTKDAQRALEATRAGVSSQQAAQLAKFAGDREFISTIYQQIAAEQKKGVEFGKSATEIFKQDAALRGLTNTAASAIARFDALATANQAASQGAVKAKSDNAYLAGLERQILVSGKARSEVVALELAELGLSERGAPLVAKLRDIDAATGQLGKQAFGTRNQLLTLKYTISDIVSSAASGISPLTILLQQGPQVAQIEGGIGGVFRTAIGLITPFRLAMGGAVAAIGALGFAYYEGSKQSKAFADSLVITGNYAGITQGKYEELAASISSSGEVTISAARQAIQALVSTGEIGPKGFDKAAEAAARLGAATGKSATDVATQFAALKNDVTGGATTMTASLNLFTASQLQQIKGLQDQGKSVEALVIVYDAINERFRKLEPNLGVIERAARGVANAFRAIADAALAVGRPKSVDDALAAAQGELTRRNALASAKPIFDPGGLLGKASKSFAAEQEEVVKDALAAKLAADQVAAVQASTTALNKEATEAANYYRTKEKGAKALVGLTRELAEEERQYQALVKAAANDKPGQKPTEVPDAKTRASVQKKIREDYRDNKGIGEADAQRKSNLAKDLQVFTEQLAKETDALKFHRAELQAIYSAGSVSLAQFYDDKVKTTAEGVQAEINAQNKATARLNAELAAGKFKDPHERTDIEKQRNESIAKSENLIRDARHAAALATYERAAAEKALTDRVVDFRAQLLQAEGDDAGAAALRARQAIDAARLFAKSTQGSASPVTDDDLARQERVINQRDALALVQARVSIATADATRSEEIFLLLATRGGADLVTQDQGILKIRTKLVEQLGEAARKTQELAEAAIAAAKVSGGVVDPKVLTEAANAARDYIVALNNVDPAYKRLQDAGNALGTSIADTLGGAIAKFTSLKDAARSVGHQIFESLTKQIVTAPLEKQIQGILGKIIDGDNPVSAALRSAAGAQDTGVRAAQTAAITASTNALVAFSNAANSAALSFGPSTAKFAGSSTDPSAANYENSSDQSSTAAEAAKSLGAFGKTTTTTADLFSGAVSTLVSSTGKAGAAIAGLPGVISNVSSYVYSLLSSASSSSSASGAASLIGKLFGGGGGSSVGSSASYAANDFIAAANGHAFSTTGVQAFAKGDVFNTPTAFRFARGGGFANGVMGEAGPEAVMPLRRGADGKLGVASAGGSNANVYNINVTTEAAPNMSRDTALQQGANIGAGIQRALARNG